MDNGVPTVWLYSKTLPRTIKISRFTSLAKRRNVRSGTLEHGLSRSLLISVAAGGRAITTINNNIHHKKMSVDRTKVKHRTTLIFIYKNILIELWK